MLRSKKDKIRVGDKSLMMIFLLEECNLDCSHCVRDDAPMEAGYKLTFQQLKQCLVDCQSLESVEWIHFSGGEPTLWREGEHSLLNLVLEISKAGFKPGFTSNGSGFLNSERCDEFIKGYAKTASQPLILYLSIDTFHKNFNKESGRARSLDNVIRSMQKLPADKRKLIDLRVAVAISKETESLLPEQMIDHYEALGVDFRYSPLRPVGKGKFLREICPDLESKNPSDLGAYERFHKAEENSDKSETVSIILIGGNYWVWVNDDFEFVRQWRKVSVLGRVSEEVRTAYSMR